MKYEHKVRLREEAGEAGDAAGGVAAPVEAEAQAGEVQSLDLRTYLDDKGNFVKEGWSKAIGAPETVEAKFKTFEGLAKSYANLEKMLGSQNKVAVPTENSPPEEWESFFQKIGRPHKADEYEMPVPEALKDVALDEKALTEVKAIAHKHGLTKAQMGALSEWYFGSVAQSLETVQAQQVAAKEQAEADLKKEWGNGYAENLLLAERGASVLGLTPEVLKSTPELSNNPHFIRAMNKVAQMTQETPGAGLRNEGGAMSINTPAAALAEIAKIRADANHAYNNPKALPRDKERAVEAMARLYQVAYPEPKQ